MVRRCSAARIPVRYGDAEDPELPSTLHLGRTKWVVSTIAHPGVNLALLQALRQHGYEGPVAVTAHAAPEAEVLKQAGAALVLLPFADAANQAAELLSGTSAPARKPER